MSPFPAASFPASYNVFTLRGPPSQYSTATLVAQRLRELEQRIQRARQAIQAFKVEMRELPRELLSEYEEVGSRLALLCLVHYLPF